ncbi:putative Phosphate acyltransferase (plsX) [Candidatus Competibacter denitrificans Run_A_D11]|jgi:glycerol-3-phosphate acyltransferase PlsX|uniref:Phosphate acyltransferase n=1 Tax=Candidatus Competibacter denitrificans Run_A_D11 TaxID=1400863 RepID=W6M8A0_9GAMM|nr:phosphate acyltransferase PlsX [Candidatus Competibacter denitrificans]CDI04191.1 putative Phosphate acyltransferase (plsX) [Candidatus Competibacter denitrificans Run_A_D11]HAS87266.1 phosphate acyltransferase PlsX [Candidatus Competibacteraceae bacterium]HRC68707.1 phosphate acyltransferase PlsX [Candidatus Competibacter denitrificans]
MTRPLTIALDGMGGDIGPDVVVPAALRVLETAGDSVRLILVGQEDALVGRLRQAKAGSDPRLVVRHASQLVSMDESPAQALRVKKDSSMRVAINLVKQGEADACVSAGNTGALMATSRFVLKTLPGIDRPAICTMLPTVRGYTRVLDLGANVDSKAEHLLQFAVMGSVLANVNGIERPCVGLLNIGEEDIKGNEQVKEAAQLLAASDLNYVGFVEGDGIFLDNVDVVVCDGFVGNVALKSSEGVAKLIRHYMTQEFQRNLLTRLVGLIALPVLRAFGRKIDPRRYNGASLLGLQGIVVKSHGGADALAFANAIQVAMLEAERKVPQQIDAHLAALHAERQAL